MTNSEFQAVMDGVQMVTDISVCFGMVIGLFFGLWVRPFARSIDWFLLHKVDPHGRWYRKEDCNV
jgi:hypothetical protein